MGYLFRWFLRRAVILLAAILIIVISLYCCSLSAANNESELNSSPFTPSISTTSRRTKAAPVRKKTPVVDRLMLERLESLWIKEGLDEEVVWYRTPNPNSPPMVLRIPEIAPKVKSKSPLPKGSPATISDMEADIKLCGVSPCRLLLPGWIAEQEPRSQSHLHQLGLLALSLNRILVLPNIWKSRFGTCYQNSFDAYFEPDALGQLGIPTVPFKSFQDWVANRQTPAESQIIVIEQRAASTPQDVLSFETMSDSDGGKHSHCLRDKTPRLHSNSFSTLYIRSRQPKWYIDRDLSENFGDTVVNALQSTSVNLQGFRQIVEVNRTVPPPDVYVIDYEPHHPIFFPIFPSPTIQFPYSSKWLALTSRIASNISPYLSVHWVAQNVPPISLLDCAVELISTLTELSSANTDIQTVYLAIEAPSESSEEYTQAMSYIREAYPYGGLTDIMEELESEEVHVGDDFDIGLRSLLDREVAASAAIFVAASEKCGGMR
jgi:hypothetical protein